MPVPDPDIAVHSEEEASRRGLLSVRDEVSQRQEVARAVESKHDRRQATSRTSTRGRLALFFALIAAMLVVALSTRVVVSVTQTSTGRPTTLTNSGAGFQCPSPSPTNPPAAVNRCWPNQPTVVAATSGIKAGQNTTLP